MTNGTLRGALDGMITALLAGVKPPVTWFDMSALHTIFYPVPPPHLQMNGTNLCRERLQTLTGITIITIPKRKVLPTCIPQPIEIQRLLPLLSQI